MIFPMSKPSARDLIDVLRSTLAQLEKSQDIAPDDPSLVELRNSIVRTIAELEIARLRKADAA